MIFLADWRENHLFYKLWSAIGETQNLVVVKGSFGGIALAAVRAIKMKKRCSHRSGRGVRALGVTTIIIYKI